MINIRSANLRDAETIIDFQIRMAMETEALRLDRKTVALGVSAIFEKPERGAYLIAEAEHQIIGSLLTIPEWSDWRNGTVLWIHSVYVIQNWRRRGVFKSMYDHLQAAVQNDVSLKGLRLYVHRDNAVAQKTYANLGMDGQHYRLFEWMK